MTVSKAFACYQCLIEISLQFFVSCGPIDSQTALARVMASYGRTGDTLLPEPRGYSAYGACNPLLWTNATQDLWRHMASLNHNEFMSKPLYGYTVLLWNKHILFISYSRSHVKNVKSWIYGLMFILFRAKPILLWPFQSCLGIVVRMFVYIIGETSTTWYHMCVYIHVYIWYIYIYIYIYIYREGGENDMAAEISSQASACLNWHPDRCWLIVMCSLVFTWEQFYRKCSIHEMSLSNTITCLPHYLSEANEFTHCRCIF